MENLPTVAGAMPLIPGFRPSRELGRGASASVWLAAREADGRLFAVKCLDAGVSDAGAAAREAELLREVRILSRLDHEHLAKTRDVVRLGGAADGSLGLVLDYAAGGSLGQLVASRGRLGIGETVTVLTPVAQALSYLHGHGMTHSDVSPGNVLFTAHGKPLLADLGIARMLGEAAPESVSGTPGFADPGGVDPDRAGLHPERDVYSLAALGWYCLTGTAPDLAAKRPPLSLLVPEVPAGLAAAIEAGLNPEGKQRPSAAELGTAIYRCAAPEPVDLSGSVHATVVPELLTLRHSAPPKRGIRGRLKAAPRIRGQAPAPGSQRRSRAGAGHGRRAGHPGHAGARPSSMARSPRTILIASVLLAVLAVSVLWLFWEPAGPPADARVTGAPAVAQPLGTAGPGVPGKLRKQLGSEDPAEAVLALSAVRDLALSQGALQLLDEVNVPGSAAAAADARIRSQLERDQTEGGRLVLAGFTTALSNIVVEPGSTGERATVAVVASTSAYAERDESGATVSSQAAGQSQQLRLVLVRTDGAWRISDILAGTA
ncbi:serine/threonine protein kinase [Arthrobacter cavernae]|uniref:non-specific serine/threonine protein kinase n=1 Tax=Arthrobacter cavernae TaxID=2817681 RepID=A0A939HKA9_9MICC|nr:serine/threonine-protein kinase [Arthrobacter cavernae]MBO1269396.1 serine/threonine protein kinase [Arthrobacter cavernae]